MQRENEQLKAENETLKEENSSLKSEMERIQKYCDFLQAERLQILERRNELGAENKILRRSVRHLKKQEGTSGSSGMKKK